MQAQVSTDTDTPLRAAAYSRVSTFLLKSKGRGLEIQDDDIDAHAARLGAPIVARWDDDESGAGWDLPGLNAMLDAARRGEFEILIVPEPDRFARNMTKQLVLEEELRRLGVCVEYARYRLDNTPEGRLLKNQLASFAEYEREKIAFRTARGRHKKAEKGLVVGTGPCPYGYRYACNADGKVESLKPDPPTAPVVQRIFADARTMGAAEIARRLDAEGVPAPRAAAGGRSGGWWPSAVRGILLNPVYGGRAIYGRRVGKGPRFRPEDEWLSAQVPALVTPEHLDAALAAMKERRTMRGRRTTREDAHLLRGLLVCGHCGGQLACRAAWQDRPHAYECLRQTPHEARRQHTDRCTLRPLRGAWLEDAIWERVSVILLDREYLTAGLAAARAQHTAEHERRAERLEIIEREVSRLRAKLARITSERLDAEPGSETERALRAAATESETIIGRLLAERAERAAQPTPGLTEEESTALEHFAERVRIGVEHARPQARRHIYELLRLRVRAYADPSGLRLARGRRYRLECQAVIDLDRRGRDEQRFSW